MNYILLPVVYFALAGRGQVRSVLHCGLPTLGTATRLSLSRTEWSVS